MSASAMGLLARGQRALAEHDLEAALAAFAEACQADPADARLHGWLARAQAAAGRMDEADATFAEATRLRDEDARLPPRSGAVFPLQRGLAWLDAGDPERARPHLQRARERAPHNDLVDAAFVLTDWDTGAARDPQALLRQLELMPHEQQARVLVRLTDHVRGAGPDAGHDADRGASATNTGGLGAWRAARARRRAERELSRAQRRAERGKLGPCLDTLRDVQPVDGTQRRRQHALFEEVAGRRAQALLAEAESATDPETRDDLILRVARTLREAGSDAEAARHGRTWLDAYEARGRPSAEQDGAVEALSYVAAGALREGDLDAAEAALEEAFASGRADGELHRVRAHLRAARGDTRGARHDFERWLAGFPLTADIAWLAAAP